MSVIRNNPYQPDVRFNDAIGHALRSVEECDEAVRTARLLNHAGAHNCVIEDAYAAAERHALALRSATDRAIRAIRAMRAERRRGRA